MKKSSPAYFSIMLLSAICLSTPSQAFTGFVAAPSAAQQVSSGDKIQPNAQSVSMQTQNTSSDMLERAPLSLRLGNRPHLFDGYLLCETRPHDAPQAHFAGFSD